AVERVAVASAELAAAVTVEVEEPDGAPEAHRAPVAAVPGGPVDLGREAVAVRQPAHHARVAARAVVGLPVSVDVAHADRAVVLGDAPAVVVAPGRSLDAPIELRSIGDPAAEARGVARAQ